MQAKPRQLLINADCIAVLDAHPSLPSTIDTIFADPPDNISLNYGDSETSYKDNISQLDYLNFLEQCLDMCCRRARTVWWSFNSRYTVQMGVIANSVLRGYPDIQCKPCVQVFTFGQHNNHDLCNCHRPLWRFTSETTELFADKVRIESWRLRHGDKRANPDGRVPSDVFDFPRVVGNAKQRRSWHPTQLDEAMVERCLRLTTQEGGSVFDPFSGTGTTLRVARKCGFVGIASEVSSVYCAKTREDWMKCYGEELEVDTLFMKC